MWFWYRYGNPLKMGQSWQEDVSGGYKDRAGLCAETKILSFFLKWWDA